MMFLIRELRSGKGKSLVMDNNRVLKKLKTALQFHEEGVKKALSASGLEVSNSRCHNWTVAESNRKYTRMSDNELEHFLDGLVILLRDDLK